MATSASRQSPIANTLQLLRKLHSPQSLIHVGAGNGTGEMQAWHGWNIDKAWIIDANPDCLQWAETLASSHPGWHVICAILCEDHEKATWHQASNPDEHSLINPEHLKPIWPNLHATSQEERITQSLDNVLVDCGEIPDASWLFIDCLPALPILKGAGQCLDHCSVLWLRVLLKPLAGGVNESASLAALEAWLQPLGYRCIETQEGNHPALGHALFVRNWQASLQTQKEKQAAENREHARLGAQRQSQIDELIKNHTNDKDQHVAQIAELQRRLSALAADLDQHARQAADHEQEIKELANLKTALEQERSALSARTKERDEQTKLAAARQARMDELAKINDEQNRQISDARTQLAGQVKQLDELTASKQAIEQERAAQAAQCEQMQKEIARLTTLRDEQARLNTQRQKELQQAQEQARLKDQRIAQLQDELSERDARQQMLNDEMTRAEAQIDLIKDVLFREPGL